MVANCKPRPKLEQGWKNKLDYSNAKVRESALFCDGLDMASEREEEGKNNSIKTKEC